MKENNIPVTGNLMGNGDINTIALIDFYENYMNRIIRENKEIGVVRLDTNVPHYRIIIDELKKILPGPITVRALSERRINVQAGDTFVRLITSDDVYDFYGDFADAVDPQHTFEYTVYVNSTEKSILDNAKEALKKYNKKYNVSWAYMTNRGHSTVDVNVESKNVIHDEYYPVLKQFGGVDSFYDQYLNSPSSILIMTGNPGTGKTSLIRDFIVKKNLKAIVTYDEKVLYDEHFFIDFLTNKEHDLLVIEDAELILTSRKDAGNKIMAKLLGVSDGIVKLFKKKIIFTSNETRIQNFDEAIIRPGRTFKIVNFNYLEYDQVKNICKKYKIKLPKEERQYTLTELFNQTTTDTAEKLKFGFM